MSLEEWAKQYGMHDMYDMITGRIYHLSKATYNKDCTLNVPVSEDGVVIGFTKMRRCSDGKATKAK